MKDHVLSFFWIHHNAQLNSECTVMHIVSYYKLYFNIFMSILDFSLQRHFLRWNFQVEENKYFYWLDSNCQNAFQVIKQFSLAIAMLSTCFNILASGGNAMVQTLWITGWQFLVKF